ncbi:MAG: hypothetical protein ACREB3_00025 [Burkholderiales bacterium]
MFFGAMVRTTRKLWTITSTATVVKETVTGFLEPNPRHIGYQYVAGVCNIKVTAKNNMTLNAVGIEGALGPPQATTPGGGFPNVAGNYESLVYTESNIGLNDGITRPFQISTRDNSATLGNTDHNRIACPVIPNFLLGFYSTTVAGAAPTITIEIWATLIGVMIQGSD